MSNDLEAKLKDVPDKYFVIIAHIIAGYINDSSTAFDHFNDPILNPSIRSLYWLFILQYAVLSFLGIVSNIAIIVYTMYHKLYKDATHAFIVNLALSHFVQCAIVLPITLMVMLIQNWIFGQFLCFFLPLLQDIPLHVAMISHLLIAWDRMRWLGDPLRGRLPAFVWCCATWLTGMVIALPYPIYTTYMELGDYVPRLHGVGLCFVNLVDDMHEYMRGLFVIMYCAPATVLAYLYIRTARELRPPDGPFAVMMFEHRADIRNRQRNSSTSSTERPTRNNSTRSYDLYNAELDVCREKRTQRNLGSMAATQVLCVCPLMILRLAKMVMIETYENSGHFDFTYLMFVWIAFLPTVIFPCIYASEILSRSEKERLRGYFRLSSKRVGLKKIQNSQEESGGKENSTEISQDPNTNSLEHMKNEKSKNSTSEIIIKTNNRNICNMNVNNIICNDDNVKLNADTNVIIDPKKPPFGRLKSTTNQTKLTQFQSINNKTKNIDQINNSCSNITSSTYCNNGGSIDFENTSIVSVDRESFIDRKWINTGLHHKDMTFSDCTFSRNDSSSTLERDLEIIDLLERERSMDIQDMMEREKRGEMVRNISVERRKLPDLGKICKSPNQKVDLQHSKYDSSSFDYPSLTSGSQQQLLQRQHQMSRKSSRSSSGRMKRDSLISGNSEIGIFNERETNKITVIENRIRASRGSTSSGRSSIKSKEHNILPSVELDSRDNIFADL